MTQDKDVYNATFGIDEYRRAYFICRMQNGYIQQLDLLSTQDKKYFAKKSRTLKCVLSKIIAFKITDEKKFCEYTQTCAILQADLLLGFFKIMKKEEIKNDKEINKYYNEIAHMFDAFSGKSYFDMVIENHPLFIVTFTSIMSVLLCIIYIKVFAINELSFIFVLAVIAIIYALFFTLYMKNEKRMTNIVRGNRIRNKYVYRNSLIFKNAKTRMKEMTDMIKSIR